MGRTVKVLIGLLVVPPLLLAGYIWIMLTWSYSSGERAGWVQKLSKKGWLCKTWEGDLAMVAMPGATPEMFYFSVLRDGRHGRGVNLQSEALHRQ